MIDGLPQFFRPFAMKVTFIYSWSRQLKVLRMAEQEQKQVELCLYTSVHGKERFLINTRSASFTSQTQELPSESTFFRIQDP